jgi:hypothetical protein
MARTAGKKQAPAKIEEDDDTEGWDDAVVEAEDKDATADLRLRDWRDVERFREMKELRNQVDDDYGLEEIFHNPLKPRVQVPPRQPKVVAPAKGAAPAAPKAAVKPAAKPEAKVPAKPVVPVKAKPAAVVKAKPAPKAQAKPKVKAKAKKR